MTDAGETGVRRSRSTLVPDTTVELCIAGARADAAILDVSLSGLRVQRPAGLQVSPGQHAELVFAVDADMPLVLDGTLVREGPAELAFRFAAAALPAEDALRALIHRRGKLLDGHDD
jgi:hypothetical protein